MSDLVGNHIIGFPTRRLKCLPLLVSDLLEQSYLGILFSESVVCYTKIKRNELYEAIISKYLFFQLTHVTH